MAASLKENAQNLVLPVESPQGYAEQLRTGIRCSIHALLCNQTLYRTDRIVGALVTYLSVIVLLECFLMASFELLKQKTRHWPLWTVPILSVAIVFAFLIMLVAFLLAAEKFFLSFY